MPEDKPPLLLTHSTCDIDLQELGKFDGLGRQLPSAIANLLKFQGHHGFQFRNSYLAAPRSQNTERRK
jgi:hypothetical protein